MLDLTVLCSNLTGYLYLAIAGGLGYLYVRFRGWHLTDFLYVSRASLKESLSSVTTGACHLSWKLFVFVWCG